MMPFISVKTSCKLSDEQKVELKSAIGEIITDLPDKTEKVLMVDIDDNHTMFFGGVKQEKCAYVDMRVYGSPSFASKKIFMEHLFIVLEKVVGIANDKAFITITPYDAWGSKGSIH